MAGKIRGVLLGRWGAVSVLRGILSVLASIASTGSFVTHERMWSKMYDNEPASTLQSVHICCTQEHDGDDPFYIREFHILMRHYVY